MVTQVQSSEAADFNSLKSPGLSQVPSLVPLFPAPPLNIPPRAAVGLRGLQKQPQHRWDAVWDHGFPHHSVLEHPQHDPALAPHCERPQLLHSRHSHGSPGLIKSLISHKWGRKKTGWGQKGSPVQSGKDDQCRKHISHSLISLFQEPPPAHLGAGQGSCSTGKPLSPILHIPRSRKTALPAQCDAPGSAPASLIQFFSATTHHPTRSAPPSQPVPPPCLQRGFWLEVHPSSCHLRASGWILAGFWLEAHPLLHFSFRSCLTTAIASLRLRDGHVGDELPTTKLSRSSPQSSQQRERKKKRKKENNSPPAVTCQPEMEKQ